MSFIQQAGDQLNIRNLHTRVAKNIYTAIPENSIWPPGQAFGERLALRCKWAPSTIMDNLQLSTIQPKADTKMIQSNAKYAVQNHLLR